MRARLALAASGQQVEIREIVLRNKPQHMLSVSPKGTVPVLVLPVGTVLEESLDIMYWALGVADPMGLLDLEPEQKKSLPWLIEQNDGMFKHALDRYKYPSRYTDEHEDLSEELFSKRYRNQGAGFLEQLEKRLKQQSYLLGARLTLADIAIAPFVRQYAHTQKEWFYAQGWPELIRWLDVFLDSALFNQVMHKYAIWTEHAEAVYFPLRK